MGRAEGSTEQTLMNTELVSGAAVEGRREAKELDEHRHGGGAPGTPVVQKAAFEARITQSATTGLGHPGLWLSMGKALKASEEVS